MTDRSTFDGMMSRLQAGDRLSADEIRDLAATPDILSLGMLADTLRRRLHDRRVTYVRVAQYSVDHTWTDAIPPGATEVRITGVPGSLPLAVAAVEQARAAVGTRVVSGYSWTALAALANGGTPMSRVLGELRGAGLDAVAEVPMDSVGNLDTAVDALKAAGFDQIRLTIDKAPAADRVALLIRAGALQDRVGCIRAINPLPMLLSSVRPTTGYDDVKMVAIARLAAPHIDTVQVDWLRYGPKLAQVALTFGADDIDGVTASDAAPDGHRRAPLEEVKRNIEAAGFVAAERDGRFVVVSS